MGLCLAGPATAAPAAPLPFSKPAAATEAFGLDLLGAQPPGNVVLAPDSIATALAMAGTGATGSTAAQIARTLHLARPTAFGGVGDLQNTIASEQRSVGEGHPAAPTFEPANGLFLQQGFPVKPTFLAGLNQHFGVAPEAVDFEGDMQGSINTINSWVSDHTNGILPEFLTRLPEETRLLLVNAVYLSAKWRHPFGQASTYPAPFHNHAGSIPVEFMHETARLRYGAGPGYRAVELPYRASRLSLMVVLPVGGNIAALQHRLSGGGLGRLARELERRNVRLSLPRFHLTTRTSLLEALESLGMTLPFSDDAEFSRITAAERLKIAAVEHAADLAVDEEGTVAAAATGIVVVPTSARKPPPDLVKFNANRPFLFFVRDDSTGALLFAGRLTDPVPDPSG